MKLLDVRNLQNGGKRYYMESNGVESWLNLSTAFEYAGGTFKDDLPEFRAQHRLALEYELKANLIQLARVRGNFRRERLHEQRDTIRNLLEQIPLTEYHILLIREDSTAPWGLTMGDYDLGAVCDQRDALGGYEMHNKRIETLASDRSQDITAAVEYINNKNKKANEVLK